MTWETDCATDCAGWPAGEPGDTDGNTTHCRLYHAEVAVGDPVLHCPHASPDGGGVCVDVDLCADVVCDAPPADMCAENTAMTYGAEGTCAEGECSYTETSTDCGDDVCTDGACVTPADPCDGVVCDAPPVDMCAENTAMTYGAEGTCADGECSYTETSTDCGGDVCTDGACVAPADPCADVVCDAPPADGCDENTAMTYGAAGTCAAGVCSYTETSTDCGDDVCTDGACVAPADPCAGVVCDTPPADDCNENTAMTYAAQGTCAAGVCSYTETSEDCGANVCNAGVCEAVDPCAGVLCNTPPADGCDGNSTMTYAAQGTCAAGVCSYTETTEDCGADICTDGACVPISAGVTYDNDVKPIYMQYCSGCHSGGNSGGTNFASSYLDAIDDSNPPPNACSGKTVAECTLIRIQDGSMPTSGSIMGEISQDQLDTIQDWIEGGYLEN
jgi:hypothetical protein